MTPEAKRALVDTVVEYMGEKYRILSLGVETPEGNIYAHMASLTRGTRQKNGFVPAQVADFIPIEGILAAKAASKSKEVVFISYPYGVDEPGVEFRCANGYVSRCVSAIADENVPDARWALEVLNKYGHLVQHEADQMFGSGI